MMYLDHVLVGIATSTLGKPVSTSKNLPSIGFDENDVMGDRYYRPVYQEILPQISALKGQRQRIFNDSQALIRKYDSNHDAQWKKLQQESPYLTEKQASYIAYAPVERAREWQNDAEIKYRFGVGSLMDKWYGRRARLPSKDFQKVRDTGNKATEFNNNWNKEIENTMRENPKLTFDQAERINNYRWAQLKNDEHRAMQKYMDKESSWWNPRSWFRSK